MNNILTKTVSVTVKDLVIGALCGVGITAGITSLFAGKLGFKLGKKSNKSYKTKYEQVLEDNKKQVEGLNHELSELRKDIAKYAVKLYSNKVENPNVLHADLSKLKLSDEHKLIIIEQYNKLHKEFDNMLFICWQEGIQYKINLLIDEMDIIKKYVDNNDVSALTLLAGKIKLDNARQEAQEAFDREIEKQREQREHEMALKKEETKKMDKYLEHLEDMKKMDVEMEATKTAAFAGVAKKAIDSFKKEKE